MVKLTQPFNSGTATGTSGEIVYQQRGKTTIARVKQPRYTAPTAAGQVATRLKFADITYLYQIMKRLTCRINAVGFTPYELLQATTPQDTNTFNEWHRRARNMDSAIIRSRVADFEGLSNAQELEFIGIAARDLLVNYVITPQSYNTNNLVQIWAVAICRLAGGTRAENLSPPIDWRDFTISDDEVDAPPAPPDIVAPVPQYAGFLRMCWNDQPQLDNAIVGQEEPQSAGGNYVAASGYTFPNENNNSYLRYVPSNRDGVYIYTIRQAIAGQVNPAVNSPTLFAVELDNGDCMRITYSVDRAGFGDNMLLVHNGDGVANNKIVIPARALLASYTLTALYVRRGATRMLTAYMRTNEGQFTSGPLLREGAASDRYIYFGHEINHTPQEQYVGGVRNIIGATASSVPSGAEVLSKSNAGWRRAVGL